MRERVVGAAYRCDAETGGHFEGALPGARHDGGGGGANLFGDDRRCVHVGIRDEGGESIAGNARRQGPRGQGLGHARGDADDHIVAYMHAEGFVDDMQRSMSR